MNRTVLVLALPLMLVLEAWAQPDTNAHGMGKNPPEAQPMPPQLAPDTPEHAIRYFIAALSNPYELNLSLAVAGARVGIFGNDEWEKTRLQRYHFGLVTNLKVDNVTIDAQTDDEATVSFTAHQEFEGQRGETQPFTLRLRREENVAAPGFGGQKKIWRVVPPLIDEVLAKPLYETPPLQFAAALATRDPRLLPAIQQYRGLNQLKQLGLGALQFTQDYDEFYAFDDAAHERALRPYLKDDSLYTIAGTKDQKWHFNDSLSTLSLAQLKEPARTVLFYDGEAPTNDKLNFRFSDKTLICFADGHCQALSKDEFKDLIWKP